MNFQPAPFNGALQAGAVLRGRALVAEQEWTVEFFDIDSAILNWFESVRVLKEAPLAWRMRDFNWWLITDGCAG
jgi:hypothetical protein